MQYEFDCLDQFSEESHEGLFTGAGQASVGFHAPEEHALNGTDPLGDASFRLGTIIN